jgi:hypothetical protein
VALGNSLLLGGRGVVLAIMLPELLDTVEASRSIHDLESTRRARNT